MFWHETGDPSCTPLLWDHPYISWTIPGTSLSKSNASCNMKDCSSQQRQGWPVVKLWFLPALCQQEFSHPPCFHHIPLLRLLLPGAPAVVPDLLREGLLHLLIANLDQGGRGEEDNWDERIFSSATGWELNQDLCWYSVRPRLRCSQLCML